MRVANSQWAAEPRQLQRNVLSARTLVNAIKTESYVPIVNVGESVCELAAGQFMGHAVPVTVTDTQTEHKRAASIAAVADEIVPGHVTCLMDTLSSSLTADQRRVVAAFVREHADVFSKI